MKTKVEILSEIKKSGFPEKEVAISIYDSFANENYSENCIGVNVYPDPPKPEKFYEVFSQLISNGKAERILVRISDIDDPKEWLFSDAVYVISKLEFEELKSCVISLSPTEIYEDFMYGKPENISAIDTGLRIYSIWWN